jgi:hypothetical protein
MREWLRTYKPAAPARVHLLLAAAMWTGVGGALLYFGVGWVMAGPMVHAGLLLAVAVLAGGVKARLVLDGAAGRLIDRIRRRGDGRCVGGFLSWQTWTLVIAMIVCGRFLRGSLLPRAIVGLVYVAVGTALLLAARTVWVAWYRQRIQR